MASVLSSTKLELEGEVILNQLSAVSPGMAAPTSLDG